MEQLGAAQPLHDSIQVGLADPGEGGGPAEPRESGRARRQRVELHAGAVGDRPALIRLSLDGNGDTRLEGKKPFGLPERHLDGRGRRRGDDLDCRRVVELDLRPGRGLHHPLRRRDALQAQEVGHGLLQLRTAGSEGSHQVGPA